MLKMFHPSFCGIHKPNQISTDLIERLAERIRLTGLFPLASKRRNQYQVVERMADRLRFRSTNLLTGINVGLNDVRIRVDERAGEIHYDVEYWTWAKYCIYLCLGIGLVAGVFLFAPLFRSYTFLVDHYPLKTAAIAACIGMIVFLGLIWPWILIAMHKRPAARCLTRLLDELNNQRR